MSLQFGACEYDLNIKCVNDTGCVECIRSENEWAAKWIEYHEKTTSHPDPPQKIQTQTQSP